MYLICIIWFSKVTYENINMHILFTVDGVFLLIRRKIYVPKSIVQRRY